MWSEGAFERLPADAVHAILMITAFLAASSPEGDHLERARQLYDAQEYQRAIPAAEAFLENPNVAAKRRFDAYLLLGSCFAILGRTRDAEVAFRRMLRGRPRADLPADTPPKILAVFRRVQSEERAVLEEVERLERERLVARIQITGEPPTTGVGAQPLHFVFETRGDDGAVASAVLSYRRRGADAYAAVPFERIDGKWTADVLAEWTADPVGFEMEWFVSFFERDGDFLVGVAGASSPRRAQIRAGMPIVVTPIYEEAWFWGVAAGVAVALGTVTFVVARRANAYPDSALGEVFLP